MLTAGTRLGHYEIRAKIGAGGMGEVYLAHDTKLDRKVALKVLPAEWAANQDRMRRLGPQKCMEPHQVLGSASSELATAIMPQSTPGAILGTVGYMSPEQAQGKINEIDHRSDIFSFGCILYEAVTGQRAFKGKDAIDSLNKIIREPVASISEFRPDAPDHLQRIVRRCLAKDREDRYQTIKDVAIELRDLRRELEGTGVDTIVPPAETETTAVESDGAPNQSTARLISSSGSNSHVIGPCIHS